MTSNPPKTPVNRLLTGMATGAGSVVVKLGLNVLLLPVIIHSSGLAPFSVYMLLVGLLELALMLDMGFSTALVKRLAENDTAPQKQGETRQIHQLAHALFLLIALLVGILGTGLAFVAPALFHLAPSLHQLAVAGTLMIAAEAALTLYNSYHKGILLSHCLHQWNNIGDTLFSLVAMVGGLLALLMGYEVEGLLALRLLGAFGRNLLIGYQVFGVQPTALFPGFSLSNLPQYQSQIRALTELVSHSVMVNVSVVISHKIDTLVIALFIPDITAVGLYELVFRITGVAQQLCIKLSEGIIPIFSRLSGSSSPNALGQQQQLFLTFSSLNNLIMGFSLVILGCFFPQLLGLLGNQQVSLKAATPLLLIAIPVLWSGALQLPASYYLFSSGHHRLLSHSSLIAAVCNLLLSLLLVKPLGVIGVALGTLIPQIIQHQLGLVATSCKLLHIPASQYLKQVHWVLLPALALVASFALLGQNWIISLSPFPWTGIGLFTLASGLLVTASWLATQMLWQEKPFSGFVVLPPVEKWLGGKNPFHQFLFSLKNQ